MEESIIEVLKEKFREEQGEGRLANPHKGSLDKGRRCCRIKDTKGLRFGKRGVVPQDTR